MHPSRAVLFAVLLASLPSCLSPKHPVDDPSTRPTAAPSPTQTQQDRLLGIRQATLAALEYAKAHSGDIPTTKQLAEHMGIQLKDFRYVVVPSGALRDHLKRVSGDWPEVLVGEKQGGADGKWAFGFVDGMCSIQSAESYKEFQNSAALDAISHSANAR